MPRSNSETPRAPPKRRQKCTGRVRQANSCITSVSSATRVLCTSRRPSDSRRTPPWARATPADRWAAVTGSQGAVVAVSAVAASRRFGVPGARPPPPLPSTQTRSLARSPHPYADRPCQCITPVYCVRIHSKYFVMIDIILLRPHNMIYETILGKILQ